ncbi:YdhW family putative oxidoreductase system protein [Edwardsiella tarda]|uniref:YdhW family putative oxidoreductase system protein n=1 Tax=Edwardsiella tarda TaxID=636 RepID=UPI001967D142|nr:YdhW family putative oxidoreductase system protein [Edwardsiella tarda]
MTHRHDVAAYPPSPPSATPVDEPDRAKRQWLQRLKPASNAVSAPTPAENSEAPEAILADFIRQHSASGRLVARARFLQPPYDFTEADLTALLASLAQRTTEADIVCLNGAQDDYYYSAHNMTANYADICLQMMEQDICQAIAEAVRFTCRTYPRPYPLAMLALPPYGFTTAQIRAALTTFDTHPDYADIRRVEAGNGAPYLFSERFMSHGKAYGLCQWIEVEQHQNP